MDTTALQRFVTSIPSLRHMLAGRPSSSDELLLLVEMRRSMRELSAALREASEIEDNRMRAEAFRAAALVAAELAGMACAPSRAGH
jgi:hypothetical protein